MKENLGIRQAMKSISNQQSIFEKYKEEVVKQSAMEQAMASAISQQTEWEKIRAEMAKPSALEAAMRSFSTNQAEWEKIRADMAKPSAIKLAMESFVSAHSDWEKIRAEMAKPSAIKQAMKSLVSHQSEWEKIRAEMAKPSAVEQGIRAFRSQQSVWERYTAGAVKLSAIEQAMKSIDSQQSVWEKVRLELAKPSAMEQALRVIARSRDVFLDQPSILSDMAGTISQVEFVNDLSLIDIGEVADALKDAADNLSNAPDSNAFFQIYSNLPHALKTFILFMIFHVFISQINSISANLLTPVVESYLHGNESTNREKISDIKKLPLANQNFDTHTLRFVSGDDVRLRRSPSINSEIIDNLSLGQVVTVISKKRNWIEIRCEYDGEVLQGWVFTRYTAKFKK